MDRTRKTDESKKPKYLFPNTDDATTRIFYDVNGVAVTEFYDDELKCHRYMVAINDTVVAMDSDVFARLSTGMTKARGEILHGKN